MPSYMETKFGKLTNADVVQLRLSKKELQGKPLLIFNHKLSKYDFLRTIDLIINTGIPALWYKSKLIENDNGPDYHYHHMLIVNHQDVNLVKLLVENIKEISSDELYSEIG